MHRASSTMGAVGKSWRASHYYFTDRAKHAECVLSSVALPTANLLISWWRRGARARRS